MANISSNMSVMNLVRGILWLNRTLSVKQHFLRSRWRSPHTFCIAQTSQKAVIILLVTDLSCFFFRQFWCKEKPASSSLSWTGRSRPVPIPVNRAGGPAAGSFLLPSCPSSWCPYGLVHCPGRTITAAGPWWASYSGSFPWICPGPWWCRWHW